MSLKLNENYIIDRFFHGECAYGPVYRKKSTVSPEQQLYLEFLLLKHDPVLIYCWQGSNELAVNFLTNRETFTKLEDVPKLKKLYEDTVGRSIFRTFKYNYNNKTTVELMMENIRTSKKPEKYNHPCLGHKSSSLVLIGDTENPVKMLKHGFKGVFNSVSGMFLMKCVKNLAPYPLIINAFSLGKTVPNDYLENKKLVTMGKNAKETLNKLGFNFKEVVHPQFAKRFYGKEAVEKYTKELQEACL